MDNNPGAWKRVSIIHEDYDACDDDVRSLLRTNQGSCKVSSQINSEYGHLKKFRDDGYDESDFA